MQTTDGWDISTEEEEGSYAGQEMGRVWFKDPTATARFSGWYGFFADSIPDARRLAVKASTITYEDFQTLYRIHYWYLRAQ